MNTEKPKVVINADNEIKELQELREKALDLKRQITKQKIKEFNIRNFKIFKNTCNFLAPFVLSAGITVGVFRLISEGFPFYTDEIIKYKTYNLDYQTEGNILMDESYKSFRWFDRIPSNELIIYTPWEYKDEEYIRYKREYDINKLKTLDLFDAVLEENYDYIKENLKDYKEEIQITNSIQETDEQEYIFEANLHMLDKNDILKYSETDLKNIIITIVELILGLGIGTSVAYIRDFNYLDEVRYVNIQYQRKIEGIKQSQEELALTNAKILSLSRKEGKSSEK